MRSIKQAMLLSIIVLVAILAGSLLWTHWQDHVQMARIAALGGKCLRRDVFYEEFNPWRVSTPYKIEFSTARLDESALSTLSMSIPIRWAPVVIEVRNSQVSSRGLTQFQNKSVEKLVILKPDWLDGNPLPDGIKRDSATSPEIQVFNDLPH